MAHDYMTDINSIFTAAQQLKTIDAVDIENCRKCVFTIADQVVASWQGTDATAYANAIKAYAADMTVLVNSLIVIGDALEQTAIHFQNIANEHIAKANAELGASGSIVPVPVATVAPTPVAEQTQVSIAPVMETVPSQEVQPVVEQNQAVSEVNQTVEEMIATNPISASSVVTNSNDTVYKDMEVPNVDSEFKAYMDYRTITSPSSTQYKMQNDPNTYTDAEGFRKYTDATGEEYYMVALGSYYTGDSCGKKFRITLDNGQAFNAVTGDVKADIHTNSTHQYRDNGTVTNVVEFIVDSNAIPDTCKKMGSMSYAGEGAFKGNIAKIELIDDGNPVIV